MTVTPELRIAVAAEYKKLAAKIESEEKAAFLEDNEPGDRRVVYSDEINPTTGRKCKVGSVSISDPTGASPTARIVDESVVLAWAVEQFGQDVVEEIPATVRLTDQGRKSVLAAALSGDDVPGVDVEESLPKAPYVIWKAEKDAPKLLASMAARGVVDIRTVLELPVGGQQ